MQIDNEEAVRISNIMRFEVSSYSVTKQRTTSSRTWWLRGGILNTVQVSWELAALAGQTAQWRINPQPSRSGRSLQLGGEPQCTPELTHSARIGPLTSSPPPPVPNKYLPMQSADAQWLGLVISRSLVTFRITNCTRLIKTTFLN